MKQLLLLPLFAVVFLASGCGGNNDPASDSGAPMSVNVRAIQVPLPNGTVIYCVTYSKSTDSTAISCDWTPR